MKEAQTPFVVVYPRGQLSANDKGRLTKVGIIAIEADDPKSVHQLQLAAPLVCHQLSGDSIVQAALKAIASQPPETSGGYINSLGRAAHEFIKHLASSMEQKP